MSLLRPRPVSSYDQDPIAAEVGELLVSVKNP
jgi:hypothetical protein